MMDDFLTIADCSKQEIKDLVQSADVYAQGKKSTRLQGKTIALYFESPSTRTKLAFSVGIQKMGGLSIALDLNNTQLARGESVEDTAKAIEQYADGLTVRSSKHDLVKTFADCAAIPVINSQTDQEHPTQAIADLLTIKQVKGSLNGLKLAWLGDGSNVCQSLMYASEKVGVNMVVSTPLAYKPSADTFEKSKTTYEPNPQKAAFGADIIVTDTWTSAHQTKDLEKFAQMKPYQVNAKLVKNAAPDYIFMHCLPAFPGEEVTSNILYGSHSVIWPEAKNKMYAQMAVLEHCFT